MYPHFLALGRSLAAPRPFPVVVLKTTQATRRADSELLLPMHTNERRTTDSSMGDSGFVAVVKRLDEAGYRGACVLPLELGIYFVTDGIVRRTSLDTLISTDALRPTTCRESLVDGGSKVHPLNVNIGDPRTDDVG